MRVFWLDSYSKGLRNPILTMGNVDIDTSFPIVISYPDVKNTYRTNKESEVKDLVADTMSM